MDYLKSSIETNLKFRELYLELQLEIPLIDGIAQTKLKLFNEFPYCTTINWQSYIFTNLTATCRCIKPRR